MGQSWEILSDAKGGYGRGWSENLLDAILTTHSAEKKIK
jgi:hypothetical protein